MWGGQVDHAEQPGGRFLRRERGGGLVPLVLLVRLVFMWCCYTI